MEEYCNEVNLLANFCQDHKNDMSYYGENQKFKSIDQVRLEEVVYILAEEKLKEAMEGKK